MKPKLRFPGYEEEWEEKKLGDLFIMLRSGLSRQLSFKNIGIPVLRANNVDGSFVNLKDLKYWYLEDTQGAKIENYIIDKGDLLINFINSIPKMGVTSIYCKNENVIYTTNLLRAKTNEKCFNLFFLYYTQTDRYKYDIISITKPAINQASFTTKDFKKICMQLPTIPEQEKIGEFFSLLDQRIEKQEEKIKLMKERKRGWMQKLFSQTIRFKDENGQDYPAWEEKKLGEVSDSNGGTSLEKYVNSDGKYKFISIGNYGIGGKYIDNGQRIGLNEKTKEKLLYKDDLVMILNDKTSSGDILGTCLLINENDKYIYNQRSQRIILDNNVVPMFMYQYINNYLRKEILKQAQGGTQIYVNYSNIERIKFLLPSLSEQEKIAEFLSKQDELIEKEEEKLSLLKEQKKGLLQQMFV